MRGPLGIDPLQRSVFTVLTHDLKVFRIDVLRIPDAASGGSFCESSSTTVRSVGSVRALLELAVLEFLSPSGTIVNSYKYMHLWEL
jgi:hypothetical protein